MAFPTFSPCALAPIAAVAMLAAPAVAATNPDLAKVEAHLAAS